MADLSSGFWPVTGIHGQRSMQATRHYVSSNNGSGIFLGDPCAASSDGSWLAAGTSTLVTGISNGASYVVAGKRISDKFLPVSTTYTPTAAGSPNASFIYTFDDPGALFAASFSAALTSDYYTYVNLSANCAGSPTGSTTTGISGYVLDQATIANGTFQFRIMALDDATADEDVSTAGVHAFVQLNTALAGANPYFTTTGL